MDTKRNRKQQQQKLVQREATNPQKVYLKPPTSSSISSSNTEVQNFYPVANAGTAVNNLMQSDEHFSIDRAIQKQMTCTKQMNYSVVDYLVMNLTSACVLCLGSL